VSDPPKILTFLQFIIRHLMMSGSLESWVFFQSWRMALAPLDRLGSWNSLYSHTSPESRQIAQLGTTAVV
jgi:hypothetical protein